jgi:hypothetical protein
MDEKRYRIPAGLHRVEQDVQPTGWTRSGRR